MPAGEKSHQSMNYPGLLLGQKKLLLIGVITIGSPQMEQLIQTSFEQLLDAVAFIAPTPVSWSVTLNISMQQSS